MSYIRPCDILKYVEGKSRDYVFPADYGKVVKKKLVTIPYVEDYGEVTDEGIVELLGRFMYGDLNFVNHQDYDLFKEYLLHKFAEKLSVKLRKKPLTDDQWLSAYRKLIIEVNKKWRTKSKKI